MTLEKELIISSIVNLSLLKEAFKQLPNFEPLDNFTFYNTWVTNLIFLQDMKDEFNIFTRHGGRI